MALPPQDDTNAVYHDSYFCECLDNYAIETPGSFSCSASTTTFSTTTATITTATVTSSTLTKTTVTTATNTTLTNTHTSTITTTTLATFPVVVFADAGIAVHTVEHGFTKMTMKVWGAGGGSGASECGPIAGGGGYYEGAFV